MTRRHRIAERLDSLPAENLRICPAKGACACIGCAGSVNGTQIRPHELQLFRRVMIYVLNSLNVLLIISMPINLNCFIWN